MKSNYIKGTLRKPPKFTSTVQQQAITLYANVHWQEINNHILLNKHVGWPGAILFRGDKCKTDSPSQKNYNVFWRLWVSWWDRCKGTKLLEGSPRAKQSHRHLKNQSCCAVTSRRRRSQNEFPTQWLTLSLANLSTLQKHGSDMPRKRHLIAHQDKKGIWENVCDRAKMAWFMKFDGAYQWQANSEETSSWRSKIQSGSHLGADWQLIPLSLFGVLKVRDRAQSLKVSLNIILALVRFIFKRGTPLIQSGVTHCTVDMMTSDVHSVR